MNKMSRAATEREQWFVDRIGKKVFRTPMSCKCASCKDVYINGLVIVDEMHASYLCEIEAVDNFEGGFLRYFDTEKERDDYEKHYANRF